MVNDPGSIPERRGSFRRADAMSCLTGNRDALWVTSWPFAEYVKHAWAGAWVCSCFRNESDTLSSDLIREAVAATVAHYGPAPEPHGFITFVDTEKTRRKRDPGRCYVKAGWTRLKETTKGGLIVLQLKPSEMPPPRRALTRQGSLFAEVA